ncbi:MAG TPA: sodium-translocating pyrophosphatase [Chthonomonadales bacterium]|nr:sodium-translocating pyrophosphatase [Chthonomonadales bacterium]
MEITIAGMAGLLALAYAGLMTRSVLKQSAGTQLMADISKGIQEGAAAFLKREFRYLAVATAVVAALVAVFLESPIGALTFIVGTATSFLAAWVGMMVSTRANARCANLARTSFQGAFGIGFTSGAVMGMSVVGAGILGIAVIYGLTGDVRPLVYFAFGSSLTALFLRVGGGILTKSADVGGDLVGKVEAGIPEDDPRNPAVIADAVGDNVGDVAGMGSDLFESYVSALVAVMFLAYAMKGDGAYASLILLLGAAGIACAVIGSLLVRVGKGEQDSFEVQTARVRRAMSRGIIVANVAMLIATFAIVRLVTGDMSVFLAMAIGMVAGVVIGWATQYYTSHTAPPVKAIAKSSDTGASTLILEGLSQGMLSTVIPVAVIAAAIVGAYEVGGLFGIAVAGFGLLSVLGVNLACDCYGPIVDNAAGIAEMAGLPEEVRGRCDALDSVGNSTAAMGKGFAIGSAALASLAWLASYAQAAQIRTVNVMDPYVIAGLFIGGVLVFLFTAITIKAVGQGAYAVVTEVRRQWRETPGLREGTAKPDYAACVDITTQSALRGMALPGALAVVTPILVGVFLGREALAAVLVSSLTVGLLMALFMSNAGGAWDNAKKYIEAGAHGGKGSEGHKAAVVGDTIGDPFKDTSGPSLNILIKILGKVAMVVAPLLVASA